MPTHLLVRLVIDLNPYWQCCVPGLKSEWRRLTPYHLQAFPAIANAMTRMLEDPSRRGDAVTDYSEIHVDGTIAW